MASSLNRTKVIRLRVTPAEKVLVEKKAKADGLTASEYVRRAAGIGHYGTKDLRRAANGPDFSAQDARVAAAAKAREVLSSV